MDVRIGEIYMTVFKTGTGKENVHAYKVNRIKIAFGDCLEVEVESEELNFLQLKEEALRLLEIAKKTVIKTPVNQHETA
jgi:hypothetical protein